MGVIPDRPRPSFTHPCRHLGVGWDVHDLVERQTARSLPATGLATHAEPRDGRAACQRVRWKLCATSVPARETSSSCSDVGRGHRLVEALAAAAPSGGAPPRAGSAPRRPRAPRQRRPLQLDLARAARDVDRYERDPVLRHGRHHLVADVRHASARGTGPGSPGEPLVEGERLAAPPRRRAWTSRREAARSARRPTPCSPSRRARARPPRRGAPSCSLGTRAARTAGGVGRLPPSPRTLTCEQPPALPVVVGPSARGLDPDPLAEDVGDRDAAHRRRCSRPAARRGSGTSRWRRRARTRGTGAWPRRWWRRRCRRSWCAGPRTPTSGCSACLRTTTAVGTIVRGGSVTGFGSAGSAGRLSSMRRASGRRRTPTSPGRHRGTRRPRRPSRRRAAAPSRRTRTRGAAGPTRPRSGRPAAGSCAVDPGDETARRCRRSPPCRRDRRRRRRRRRGGRRRP